MFKWKRSRPRKGLLIVYEGISGSGKSAGIREMERKLAAEQLTVTIVEWNTNPGVRFLVQLFDRMRLMTPGLYSMLQWIGFALSLFSTIAPALKRGHIVIADRYIYTGMARDAANGAAEWIGRPWHRMAPSPDLVFFCETPPGVCYERILARGKRLYHPTPGWLSGPDQELKYLEQMRLCYLQIFGRLAADSGLSVQVLQDTVHSEAAVARMEDLVLWLDFESNAR